MKTLFVLTIAMMWTVTCHGGTIEFSNGSSVVDLNYTSIDIGGGLVRHDVFIDDPLNANASYFLQSLGFTGVIAQNQAFAFLAVDSSVQAAVFDANAAAGYSKSSDSFFFSPFAENTVAPGITDSAGAGLLQRTYSINAGSGGGSQLDLVQIAQIVTSSDVLVAGAIGRSGKTFVGSGVMQVPEPSSLALFAIGTIWMVRHALVRRRRRS